MNLSRNEQRVLHALAQGGRIIIQKDDNDKKVISAICYTRDGWVLAHCDLAVFAALKRKRLIGSKNSSPYHINRRGLAAVRAQLDNR